MSWSSGSPSRKSSLPLYYDAGTRGPLDAQAASALLQTVLLGTPAQIDALATGAQHVEPTLIGYGADAEALEKGELFRAVRGVAETIDHERRTEHDAAGRWSGAGGMVDCGDAASVPP